MDLCESINAAAVREVEEETGVKVEVPGLEGIHTDPGHVMAYDDGEVRQEFSVCFHARYLSGEPREDGTETKAARWVEPDEVPELSIHPSMRRRRWRARELDRAVPSGSSTPCYALCALGDTRTAAWLEKQLGVYPPD